MRSSELLDQLEEVVDADVEPYDALRYENLLVTWVPDDGPKGCYLELSAFDGDSVDHVDVIEPGDTEDAADLENQLMQAVRSIWTTYERHSEDWIGSIEESRDELVLRFASGDGHHYVGHWDGIGFKAVYAGPHGPENKAADIDKKNIEQLLELSDEVRIVPSYRSPFKDAEVIGQVISSAE